MKISLDETTHVPYLNPIVVLVHIVDPIPTLIGSTALRARRGHGQELGRTAGARVGLRQELGRRAS
jgi:hypothetical protein